ncbi:glutamate--tRNA ligase [Cellulosilyticum ruminicola]|uniref:glutamate--tRNA ligase n=1 Tax=Cellulosilyticum ruminicola TaxID=425254 RepID=UPI0006CFAC60|nr:glutamate--tRNA ligase [Cellulosilyticum ruminicola]
MSLQKLADLIFPDITKIPADFISQYPKRELKEGARVTRYAPSPTGFQHIGGVFAALVSERIAHQSGGIFYLRIEDTDQKREVEGAIDDTIATMHNFGMDFDEGMTGQETSKGIYGPYKQSEREEIYKTFAKDLIVKGLAYPCFCTPEELNEMREKQVAAKITPGCYGEYAIYRNLSADEAIAKIESGTPYILRLKSPGDAEKRIQFTDLIKGETSFPENIQDVVIIKADGLPTYHFAHAIDDHLMGTTTVIRGEEWLSSLPIHVQLFDVLGFERPEYAHIPNVMKLDGDSKRKLSKRKDPESAVSYYKEEGYPRASVVEYLLNIINSTFEEWRMENPKADYLEFPVALDKMSKSGALFDLVKLNDVSKDVISKMPAEEVYTLYTAWAKEFDQEMYDIVTAHKEMSKAIFGIDKEGPKPRKDFGKWSEVKEKICYFYNELFSGETEVEFPKTVTVEEAKEIITGYKEVYDFNTTQEEWFEELKAYAVANGYAADRKAYKKAPEAFKGMVSDVAGAVRTALTHRTNTPDLYTIMQIIGEEEVRARFSSFIG